MPFQDLKDSIREYLPALIFDDLLGKRARHLFRTLLGGITTILFLFVMFGEFFDIEIVPLSPNVVQGLLYIFLSLWLELVLLEAFYHSYYFKDLASARREQKEKNPLGSSYVVAQIVYHTGQDDITTGFLTSFYGRELMLRLGLDGGAVSHFLQSRKSRVGASQIQFAGGVTVTAPLYAKAVFTADQELSRFLFALSIQEKEWSGAAEWVFRLEERRKEKSRFWGKENLGTIPSIGKTWSYGQIFTLKQFAEEFEFGASPEEEGVEKEVNELEQVLARAREANALIVADTGSEELTLPYGLVYKIRNGIAQPTLEDKRVFRLNGEALIDTFAQKPAFESSFVKIMNEAVAAGNIILVFSDLPGFIESAHKIGSSVPELLYPYLTSSKIQIIAIADKNRFHEQIEGDTALTTSFEIIRLQEKDETSLIPILENEVLRIEAQTGLFFTYEAIEAIAESAARFFTEGVAIDKAKDILLELPGALSRAKRAVVRRGDVLSLVETKTGIPREGEVAASEKDKLLDLEKILHARVIGQDEAITAIANSVRRARAGLRNPARPIGSYLFLGPTGVGKTETAKALTEVFFGSSAPIMRLDMSEYADDNSLTRLIGSFDSGHAGVLSTMLRDQKYGLLLLDEFEKTTTEVKNLFLQILDEGVFSDMFGKKINARNVIIIATSNAGSDTIFKLVEQGKNLEEEKSSFVDSLVESGKFTPELLNRFDGIILFHPLQESQLKEIAKLSVGKLAKELRKQGIELRVTDDLVTFLAKEGFDPKFGARPMNRVLQEEVEKLLAEKIIKGEIKKGSTIEIVHSWNSLQSLEVKEVTP